MIRLSVLRYAINLPLILCGWNMVINLLTEYCNQIKLSFTAYEICYSQCHRQLKTLKDNRLVKISVYATNINLRP